MIPHAEVRLAFRAKLLTLEVCTTGSMTLEATATGYARASGSFAADGFAVGMEVTPTGFPQVDRGVITALTALAMTIDGGRTVAAPDTGRTVLAGAPELIAWENLPIPGGRVTGKPYGQEAYVPAPPEQKSGPASGGMVVETGLYRFSWFGPPNTDGLALDRSVDKLIELFRPGTTLTLAGGLAVRVLHQGPWRGPIRIEDPGWAVVVTTIPWTLFHNNT